MNEIIFKTKTGENMRVLLIHSDYIKYQVKNKKRSDTEIPYRIIFIQLAATTAAEEHDDKRDDDPPDVVVAEKIAKTVVHNISSD